MDFFSDHAVGFALVCAAAAVLYGLYLTYWLLSQPAGNERMREISGAVQEGAAAYLKKQYTAIAVVAIAPILLIGFYNKLGWGTAFGFVIGAVLSAAAGFIGMNVAVRSNSRTAEAAREGVAPAFKVAFRAGSVTGLLVVGLGLFGVAGYYWFLTGALGNDPKSAVDDLLGLAFGGSLISVFARLGGGIFTKAADVGADLVGKIEAGIPEDDPRNPAVIADNVGDNVGDCAGMAADLFETYAVTAVAVMLLGTAYENSSLWLYPLALGGISILASIIGTFFARVGKGENAIINALYMSVLVATVLSAIGFIPVTKAFEGPQFSFWQLYGSALVGLAITFLLVAITEYYTGSRWSPVKKIAEASTTGHATNIIAGLAKGMEATALPVVVIAGGVIAAYEIAGGSIYGIGVAVMAQLSMCGLIVALDAFGPVTDNAGGIAEMADMPEVGARRDRSARRGRQHDQGRHEGLRDRLRRSRGADPVRRVHAWPRRGRDEHGVLARQPVRRRRALHRRHDAVPLRRARDDGRRPRRRRGGRGGPPPVPGGSGHHGGHLAARLLAGGRHRHELGDPGHDAPGRDPDRLPDRRRHHQPEDARRAADRHDRDRSLPRDLDDLGRRRLGQREEADRGRRLRWQGIRGARRLDHGRHGR